MLEEVNGRIGAVVQRIASGDYAGAAEQFVDTVVLDPGAWEHFPPDVQKMFTENAPTFLDEAHDPNAFSFDLTWIKEFPLPVLLTTGDQSPPLFAPVVTRLVDILPSAETVSIKGAGHIPHETHPDVCVEAISTFILKHSVERPFVGESAGGQLS